MAYVRQVKYADGVRSPGIRVPAAGLESASQLNAVSGAPIGADGDHLL